MLEYGDTDSLVRDPIAQVSLVNGGSNDAAGVVRDDGDGGGE